MTTFIDALASLSRDERHHIRSLQDNEGETLPARLELLVPDGAERWPYVLVARLYAREVIQPERGRTPLALAMARLNKAHPSGIWEKRFAALLDTRFAPESIHHQLHGVVRMMREQHMALDWDALLADLQHWDDPERDVQLRWARQFWTAGDPAERNEDPELTIPEIVKRYELGDYYDRMLRRIAGTERLPARKSGHTWLIRESDIEHWLETKPRPGRQPA